MGASSMAGHSAVLVVATRHPHNRPGPGKFLRVT
jgi:hypothetical protein